MSRATDVLLFLILLVSLQIYYELGYGADAPEDPPMLIVGVAVIGAVALLGSLVPGSTEE